MARQNRKNPGQGTCDELASAIKGAARGSQNLDIQDTRKQLPVEQRSPEVREAKLVTLKASNHLEAAYVQIHGMIPQKQCQNCQLGKGPFKNCVIAGDGPESEIMGGSCANCYYENGYSFSTCDLRHLSQLPTNTDRTVGLKKRKTASRSHHKEQSKESRASKALLRESKMLKRRHEEENTIQPSRKKLPPNEASEDVRRGDRLMLLGLELPEIDPSSFDLELLKQFKEEQEHLQMLEGRSMSCLRKSIVDIEKAFKSFKIQEMEHDTTGLVKPSGTLQARLGHYLNQPSFSTIQNVYEDGETADDSNPCIRMILENGYAENKALIMDHLHYRSPTSEDITEVDSPTLQRHEEFTSEILESLEAKVVIVYGSKVQNRLIATRNLVHVQLWGEYSEVSIALDLEKNYKFSDDNYRFRRVFLLAAHPNRIMWQTKGDRALIRQDAILKAAANMAGVSGLVVPQFYQDKLWSRDNPQRSAVLKEIRDKTQISIPKKPSTSPLSVHVPKESESSGWSGFWSNQSIHNNKTLAESVLPLALTFLNIEGNEHQFNWSNPRELPPPVLKWIQGSRYALFNSNQLPDCDHGIIQAICDTAFGKKSTTQPPFKETLRLLIEKQDTLVRRALERNFEDSVHSELHCGVGQGLVLCCQKCGHESIHENPLWAVKWPGHYFQFPKNCKSRTCSWRKSEPKELHVLRTPGQVSSIVKNEGFDPDYAFRLCLRTQEQCSGLEQVVESWCLLCKGQTILSGNRTRLTDHRPRYTLGRTPLYVERRPDCLRCKLRARVVPVQEIASIMPRIIRDFAKQIVYLDREVKSHLMDSVPLVEIYTSA